MIIVANKTNKVGIEIKLTIPTEKWAKFKPSQKAAFHEALGALLVASCRTKADRKELDAAIQFRLKAAHAARSGVSMKKAFCPNS